MITCPESGEPLFTGIRVDDATSWATGWASSNAVKCPHCGGTHTWSKEGAYLDGTDDTTQPPSTPPIV
jgi:hypothetical protein